MSPWKFIFKSLANRLAVASSQLALNKMQLTATPTTCRAFYSEAPFHAKRKWYFSISGATSDCGCGCVACVNSSADSHLTANMRVVSEATK